MTNGCFPCIFPPILRIQQVRYLSSMCPKLLGIRLRDLRDTSEIVHHILASQIFSYNRQTHCYTCRFFRISTIGFHILPFHLKWQGRLCRFKTYHCNRNNRHLVHSYTLTSYRNSLCIRQHCPCTFTFWHRSLDQFSTFDIYPCSCNTYRLISLMVSCSWYNLSGIYRLCFNNSYLVFVGTH